MSARRRAVTAIVGLALVLPLAWSEPSPARAATFVVTTTEDAGEGSLRQAILDANDTPEGDTIAFALEGALPQTITPGSALPAIIAPVVIDASAQQLENGAPGIVIDGATAEASDGLVLAGGADESVIRALQIVGFQGGGIHLQGASGTLIEGNYLGTDGTEDLGNLQAGILVEEAGSHTIRGNLISGNGDPPGGGPCCTSGFGINVGSDAPSNTIVGNLIGTTADGTEAVGNGTYGISIASTGNQVGGVAIDDRNVISGNGRGIQLVLPAADNVVEGNFIGTNAAGTSAIGNLVHGVVLNVTTGTNTIGGTAEGAGNVISGNAEGIVISAADNAVIQGNLIGVDATGSAPIPNLATGINITSGAELFSDGNLIGGSTEGAGNVISGNGSGGLHAGILVQNAGTSGTVIQGNWIGTDRTGTEALGNHGGIRVMNAGATTIGGDAAAANVIAFNTTQGVEISGSATGVTVSENSIHSNGALGIDLVENPPGPGVTPNDPGDADPGPNANQNFPILTDADASSVSGTLDSGAPTYRVELFSNATCDASGNGEGATFLQSLTVSSGPFAADALLTTGTILTATATNLATGETSEFSPCFTVTDGLPPGTWAGDGPGTFVAAGVGAAGPAQFTYDYETPSSPSGTWDFFTTADTSGTILVPWHYSGFHAFFQVEVGLSAVVTSATGPDTVTQLVAAGPTDCCTPPSGSFTYSGVASFDVEAGDVYGFTLSGSNLDETGILSGALLLGNAIPADCDGAQELYLANEDGRYVIQPEGGQRFSVHCHGMSEFPDEYLLLRSIGAGVNYSSYGPGGSAGGPGVTTSFTRVRLDPATLTVDVGDLTFATSTGQITHPDAGGPIDVTSMPYATAMACGGVGTANVDLRGTPFVVDDTFTPGGTAPTGGAVFSSDDQVVDITGGGGCGWTSPDPGAFNPFNPAPGNFALQLAYALTPAIETPVLFRAITTGTDSAFLVGRVDGAADAALTLEVTTSATCDDGQLVGGSIAEAAVSVTTDPAGYFGVLVTGVPAGDFVAARITAPEATGTSGCLVSSGDNDFWPKALDLAGSTATADDVIDVEGKARWYKFTVTPDQRITVTLTGLPADYDLSVFKDIGKEFAELLEPTDPSDLTHLSAEYAPSAFSPSAFSPSAFSPSAFSPDAYSPSAFSPSAFSPSVFTPSAFSPSAFSPSAFSPSAFSPSAFSPSAFSPSAFSPSAFSPSAFSPSVFTEEEVLQAFSSAQTRSLIGVSAMPGTGDETVVVNSWNNTGSFYVRVGGRGGAFDPTSQFTVTVEKSASTCEAVTDTVLTPRAAVPGIDAVRTVILTDTTRLALGDGSPTSPLGRLEQLADRPEVAGVVVDVASDQRVQQLWDQAEGNPGCPFATNLVAEEIKSIVDSYRPANPGLRYVVIAGGDTVIPFFRYPDQSLLGQESGYVPPVRSDSISEASLRRDFVLSQDAYGSGVEVSLRTNEFPVPGLAVGRLVETPTEIVGMLDAYNLANGSVAPTSSLVTGYDFLEDAANAVRTELQAGTGRASDTLITPNGVSPQDPASWTATQLGQKLLGSRHDVIFLAGHFSANSALAADFTTSLITTDVAASTVNLTNSLVFSAGCHSGYNLLDGEALAGVSLPLDWAQAFAQKQATLVAGTGYQYGDTDFLEYSERLYRNFAAELRAGTAGTAVPVGEALVRAKADYLATTPDIRGIHEKALLEATLFGLPMLAVNMPAGRGAPPDEGPGIDAEPVGSGPAAELGLATAELSVAPTLTPRSLQMKNPPYDAVPGTFTTATWLEGPDGVTTNPAEPALPLDKINVTPTDGDLVLRGVGFRGGSYLDTSPMTPLTGAPTTELRGVHAPFVSPVFYPMRLWTPNYFGALAGTGGTNLLVTPAQHRDADPTQGTSTQRRFTDLDLRLFYSDNLTFAALSDAPSIVSVRAETSGSDVVFTARVVGDPAVAVHEVWVTWTADAGTTGTWAPLDLQQCVAPLPAACGTTEDSRTWKGVLASAPANLEFVVQAANGVGLVSFDDNRGSYYQAQGVPTAQPVETALAIQEAPASAQFGESITVRARLTSAGDPLLGRIVAIAAGGSTRFVSTGSDGVASATLPVVATPGSSSVTVAYGGSSTELPSSDSTELTVLRASTSLSAFAPFVTATGTAPTGAATTLTATIGGKSQPLLQQTVTLEVAGPVTRTVSSITDYLGRAVLPRDLPVGTYTIVAIFAGDATYAPATRSGSLTVAPFTGFFAPVDNPPTLNAARAGSTIPVKFSLGGNRGLDILATGYPRAIRTACPTGQPPDAIEEYATASTSGLRYDATTDRYTYSWQAPRTLRGCYTFELRLVDGSVFRALFSFR